MSELAVQCSHCGASLLHHEHIGDPSVAPDAGSVAMCWGCDEPSMFETAPGGGLRTRKPTAQEQAAIDADPRVRIARLARVLSPTPAIAAEAARRAAALYDAAGVPE